MFTQCSKCETIFRLSAETLRAAGGQVRCGRCGEVFNALARLAEDASAFPPGESALEMEARADEILHSSKPAARPALSADFDSEDLGAADSEFARLQVIDKFQPPEEASHEPRAPARPKPAETGRASAADGARAAPGPPQIPKEATSRAAAPKATAMRPAQAPAAPIGSAHSSEATEPASADDSALEFTLPPGELDRIFVDPTSRARAASRTAAEELSPQEPVHEPRRFAGLEVSEDVRREMLAGMKFRPLDEPGGAASRTAFFAWLGAAAVLCVTLGAQMIHENRDWLAVHGPLRGPLAGLYGALGIAVQTPASLSAYQLRQWGVTGDPSAAGTLRVRASILNTAAQLQPYPLLRVMLENRFGARIGSRDFEPSEYLGKPTARMMTPGERADATLDILDPGKDAEGFEIDVCLRGADRKIACAGDAAAQSGSESKQSGS